MNSMATICATPGCGKPAMYATRTKPAYCETCVHTLIDKAGLKPITMFSKPNEFFTTQCKTCGVVADYSFNYVLSKIKIGEPVCRACYWKHWFAQSWDDFGCGQGLAHGLSEEGARYLAHASGYELVQLIPGAVEGEEPLLVRCSFCGRQVVETPKNIVWRCTCNRKQHDVSMPVQERIFDHAQEL